MVNAKDLPQTLLRQQIIILRIIYENIVSKWYQVFFGVQSLSL